MMLIGFTGTQDGMTPRQLIVFGRYLDRLADAAREARIGYEFSHGGCVGADEDAHGIAYEIGFFIHVRPCDIVDKRSYCWLDSSNEVMPRIKVYRSKPPLDRNTDIVRTNNLMIATPSTMRERMRSGTWATIRRARRLRKPLLIIYPDGSAVEENL